MAGPRRFPDYLREMQETIEGHARGFGLDFFPIIYEVLDYKTMNEVAAYGGFPTRYPHWRFGMDYEQLAKGYEWGLQKIYEMVINTNPAYAYLLEGNSLVDQKIVMAHVCAHVDFFKHNYYFGKTNRKMIDGMANHAALVRRHMERQGQDVVEDFIDTCLSLENLIDPMSPYIQRQREAKADDDTDDDVPRLRAKQYMDKFINPPEYLEAQRKKKEEERKKAARRFPEEPQENLLYFIEKNAPLLEPWQREIVRIVRKVAQYFYPQRQTQVMNEGWATFWHHKLLNTMYDDGFLTDGVMIEWLKSHTNVIHQLPVGHRGYSGLNPYALGFAMYTDIKRICEAPTDEDRAWFPAIAGSDWLETLDHAMRNFKDESFVGQYLSPKLMRDFRLFSIVDDEQESELEVAAIHDESGYRAVREALSHQYDLGSREPNIQVWSVNLRGDRSLTLRHTQHNDRPLHETAQEVLKHVARLWGFGVQLESVDAAGEVKKRCQVAAPPQP